ncbi:hypothetical protein Tco_0949909, partial [Tanacetum coccineum]
CEVLITRKKVTTNTYIISLEQIYRMAHFGIHLIDVVAAANDLNWMHSSKQLMSAIEDRGLKIGKATFQRIEKPILDKDRILNWHVLLLYAGFPEDSMFDINELLDVVDQKGESINEEGSSSHPMYDAWF